MSTPDLNETGRLAWAKILIGAGVLTLSASSAFDGGPWWKLLSVASAAAFSLGLLIIGLRDLSTRRRARLKARE